MSEWNEQSKIAAEKLEHYILETEWEDLPTAVQERAVTCTVDLFATMIMCSQTCMAKSGIDLTKDIFQHGDIPVIGSAINMNMVGAVTAYGYNVNALDIDDGHNLIKGHPGSVLMAGLLPSAIKLGATYKDFLTALIVGYEVAIRAGLALHKYYNFYHGTGSWGAFGVAAAVSKIMKLDRATLSNALGIADYQGPLAPVMRIVEIPSMNKDGIAWGAVTGAMAVEAAIHGVIGQFYNLLEPEFGYLIDSLGKEYECLNLYFKYFPCCRWAQAAVMCALELREQYNLKIDEIQKVFIRTFKAGTQLSSVKPLLSDEAQYNMVYPVCVALAEGKFAPPHVSEKYMSTSSQYPKIAMMMDRVEFVADVAMEAEFPVKRLAQVEVLKKDGTKVISDIHEPWGEKEQDVGLKLIKQKFSDNAAHCFSEQSQKELLNILSDVNTNVSLRQIVEYINKNLLQ